MRTPRAPLDAMIADYRAVAGELDSLIVDTAALTASAGSSDRCVQATVGVHGQLTELTIDAAIAARLDTRALAARVVEATQLASAAVRERVRVRVAAGLPDRLRHLIGPEGRVDVRRVLPADPDELAGWPEGGPR